MRWLGPRQRSTLYGETLKPHPAIQVLESFQHGTPYGISTRIGGGEIKNWSWNN
jgi:hypothetical protein